MPSDCRKIRRSVKYAIRLPQMNNLVRDIEELLTRPVGRPNHKPIVWYKGVLVRNPIP